MFEKEKSSWLHFNWNAVDAIYNREKMINNKTSNTSGCNQVSYYINVEMMVVMFMAVVGDLRLWFMSDSEQVIKNEDFRLDSLKRWHDSDMKAKTFRSEVQQQTAKGDTHFVSCLLTESDKLLRAMK